MTSAVMCCDHVYAEDKARESSSCASNHGPTVPHSYATKYAEAVVPYPTADSSKSNPIDIITLDDS